MRNIDLTGGGEFIPEDECWTLLRSVEYGRLAVDVDGRPDVFPVNFAVVDGSVVLQTNMGRKLLAALRGEVAFEADHVDHDARTGWSVVIHGQAVDASDEWPPIETRSPYTGPKEYILRIVPTAVSGRRIRISRNAPARMAR